MRRTRHNKQAPVWGTMIVIATLLPSQMRGADAGALSVAEFERLHREIRPRPGEAVWAEIPWMYDLHKARQKAAAEGKPLCVWRMAGDPTAVC